MDNGVNEYNTSKSQFLGGRLRIVSNFVSNKLTGELRHPYKSMG